ncbi:hypothetical protein ACQUJV_19170 [Ralstonia pseudosolanacearum]
MSKRAFSEPQLLRYITALHEAAHTFVAHKAEHWKINDPAVTFPEAGTGHLARAHFGPKMMQPNLTKEHVREFIKIGFAGAHGQNLIDQHLLLSVLSSGLAGCEDDLLAIEEKAQAAGIEHEIENLMQQSLDLVRDNAQTIHALADVIYNATSNVSRADLLKVLGAASKPELRLPRARASSSWPLISRGLCGWLRSLFSRRQ